MQKTDPALSSPLTMVQIVVKLVNGIIATSRPFYPPPLYHLPPSFTSTSTSAGSAPPSSSSPPFPRKQSSFPRRHLHHSQTLHLSNLKLLALKRKQRREREARIDRRSEMRLGGLRKETQRIHEQNQELEAEIMRIQQRTVELMREVRWEEMLGEMIAGEEARRD
ncbi:hypothetical protein BCR35DRAFT_168503 [Leucosporidium creatinivorum]|uniref:Uncharacterized protein n=1 Tax=Leucosporidium creatinivorum TaxID=106004 RepID=A0A1Y2ECZ0_9BASI|nr:hypothetical protein BCR35DRAFT_168503 [Leucosporidium creatinivorum]